MIEDKKDIRKYIRIRGANEHNLKNINLDIPRNQFVVLTGLSGGTKVMCTPILRIPAVGPGFWLYCGYLLLPSACHMKERIAWRISISRI